MIQKCDFLIAIKRTIRDTVLIPALVAQSDRALGYEPRG